MSEPKINTSASLTQSRVTDKDLEKQINALNAKLKKEKKEKISFPVGLKKNLGPSVFLGHNGSHIVVPVDGEEHLVPATFAKKARRLINNLTT